MSWKSNPITILSAAFFVKCPYCGIGIDRMTAVDLRQHICPARFFARGEARLSEREWQKVVDARQAEVLREAVTTSEGVLL